MKAYFLQRAMAYLIDIFIIAIFLFLIKGFIPGGNDYDILIKDSEKLSEKFLKKEISAEEFLKENGKINYDIQKSTYMWSVADAVVYLAYFVCFQTYYKKQTIGKMIMKISIRKKDGSELSYNDSLKRAFILHGLFVSILMLILITFLSSKYYIPVSTGLEVINTLVLFVSILMAIFRKDGRGLHDLFANTEVVVCEDRLPEVISLKEVVVGINNEESNQVVDNDVEEGSVEDEGTSRTRNRKKRKNSRDK